MYEVAVELPPLNLYPGRYLVRLAVTDVVLQSQRELQRLSFEIVQNPMLCQRPLARRAGLVFAAARWQARPVDMEVEPA